MKMKCWGKIFVLGDIFPILRGFFVEKNEGSIRLSKKYKDFFAEYIRMVLKNIVSGLVAMEM